MNLKGNDILLMVDGEAVASAKTCNIDVQCDTIEFASPTSGTWKEFIAGRSSWSASIGYLVTSVKAPILKVGATVAMKIGSVTEGTRTVSTDAITGTAICTHAKINANRGSLAQGSWQFKGTGQLVEVPSSIKDPIFDDGGGIIHK